MTAAQDLIMDENTLISVRGVRKYFPVYEGWFRREVGAVKAVDDITFDIRKGETFGLVGESGSGKSSIARLILRAYDLTGGEILFRRGNGSVVDISRLSDREMRDIRREMQMIFQDPYSSLNPRMTLLELVGEPMVVHGAGSESEIRDRVAELLRLVGLRPEYLQRYPHAFSGGQRQRIGIARAIALTPELVICDEPISALDVSIQAQVVNMLEDLQAELGLTYLFITHDLSMVRHISDRIGVMYLGKIVELAGNDTLYRAPAHPYTQALLASIPVADPEARRDVAPMRGEIPSPIDIPSGCRFRTRCPFATELCARFEPPLSDVGGGHLAACHYAAEVMAGQAVAA